MTTTTTAGRQIVDEVTSWPGVSVTRDEYGTVRILFGRREIGHLHGDRAAHFGFPKLVWQELRRQERIVPHPVFPDRAGPAARAIENEADVRDVVELLRLNYDRVVARYGLPDAG